MLLALFLVEATLQVASRAARWWEPGPPRVQVPLRADEYRILCLGDSVTDGFGVTPYPRILADLLPRRELGRRFRVINSGYRAAHSGQLAERLPHLLEIYRPHMVIAMLGVNDQFYFEPARALGIPEALQRLLLRSRLYRLLTLAASNLGGWLRGGSTAEGQAEAYAAAFDEAWALFSEGRLEGGEQRFAALIEMARRGARPGERPQTLRIPQAYLRSYYNSYLALARIHLSNGRVESAVALYEEAVARHPEAEFFQRALAGLHESLGDRARAERHRRAARELARARAPAITRASLRSIERLLADRGIAFVAMQYPLREVEALRAQLDDDSAAIAVDNDAVFRTALARFGYEALFIDRFAGDFGHPSEAGHRLIAENLIASVLEPMFRRP